MSDEKSILQRLKQVFNTEDSELKREFLSQIPEEPMPGLAEFLVKHLDNEADRAVKTRILLLFEHILVAADMELIEIMLRSNDPFVRNGAIDLIKRTDRNWHPFLLKLAKDSDKDIRKFIVDSLTNDDSPVAREILRDALQDSDVNIVYTAIEQLGSIGDLESAAKIEDILFDSTHPMVLCSALEALAKIGVCSRREDVLERFINHSDSLFFFPLIKFIARFGDSRQIPFLEKLIDQDWSTYSKEIIDALTGIVKNQNIVSLPKALLEKLENKARESNNTPNRYAIMQLISSLDLKNMLEKARAMLQDANPMVKLCGIEIIAERGGAEDIPLLDALAEQSEQNDELLEAIGDAFYKIDKRLSETK